MDDFNIYQAVVALQDSGRAAALATVVESAGSSPRKAGAKMLVFADGLTVGTVGGGRVELETILAARAVITTGACRTVSFSISEEYGEASGGTLVIFIEPIASAPRLLVIGAGQVGQALARIAGAAGFQVMVADERPQYAQIADSQDAVEIHAGNAASAFGHFAITEDTFVVITTSSLEDDFDAVRAALKSPASYIGLTGSTRKREVLRYTLVTEGFSAADIARVRVPVGLPIGAETPEEIAVSVIGQLIQTRRSHGSRCADSHAGSGTLAQDGMLQPVAGVG